jgi:hypothetical protein
MVLPVLNLRFFHDYRRRVSSINTVAYLLKARTVEPEKQPLLANGSETFVSR